ncbi:hypothetical protein [Streptomyces sp. NPDC102476]
MTRKFRAAVAAASPLRAVRESLANSARCRRGVSVTATLPDSIAGDE